MKPNRRCECNGFQPGVDGLCSTCGHALRLHTADGQRGWCKVVFDNDPDDLDRWGDDGGVLA